MATQVLSAAPHRRLIESATGQLTRIEDKRDGALITMPLMYPSGSMAVVRVNVQGPNRYFVTDMGIGYLEAEMMGMSLVYARNAAPIAEHAGIHFDHQAFSLIDVLS